MKYFIPVLILFSFSMGMLWVSFGGNDMDKFAVEYKKERTYDALVQVSKHLNKGMQRPFINALLGKPDYSPIDGQYYYAAKDSKMGLVLDFRAEDSSVTDQLTSFELLELGE